MNKLLILLVLLTAVLFTAGCTGSSGDSQPVQENEEKSVVIKITELEQINESIQEGPVFVKIGSLRCGACRQMDPILDDLAAEYGGRITITSVDLIQSPQFSAYFIISYIPDSFIIVGIEDGEYVYMQEDGNVTTDRLQARVLGLREKHVYEELINRAILYNENINAKH